MAQESAQESYDRVPYTSYPYRESHPRKLQAVAHVYGLKPPGLGGCRVLELGCAGGGNLVPMGEQLPGGRFVGVDYSGVQIGQARELAAGAGVTNVEFRRASIADLGKELGEFDYVIAHGLFSWVKRELQEEIFRNCRELLTPNGVAYISFNTLPGWHGRGWVREAMVFHTAGIADPVRKVEAGREFLRVLAGAPWVKGHHAALIKEELGRLEGRAEDYVLHDYFEDVNEPVYFEEFMKRAGGYGLQYVADARVNGTAMEEGWGPSRGMMEGAGEDVVRREQYADFLRNRSFRRAVLCRAGERVDRAGAAGRVGEMWVTGLMRVQRQGDGSVVFAGGAGASYRTGDPKLIGALSRVAGAHPGGVAVREVAREDEGVVREIVKAWEAGLVELYVERPGFAGVPGERPVGSGVARYLAGRGVGAVTNRRHEVVMVSEEQRRVLVACDGTRGVAEVEAAAGVAAGRGGEVVGQLGRLAMMVG